MPRAALTAARVASLSPARSAGATAIRRAIRATPDRSSSSATSTNVSPLRESRAFASRQTSADTATLVAVRATAMNRDGISAISRR